MTEATKEDRTAHDLLEAAQGMHPGDSCRWELTDRKTEAVFTLSQRHRDDWDELAHVIWSKVDGKALLRVAPWDAHEREFKLDTAEQGFLAAQSYLTGFAHGLSHQSRAITLLHRMENDVQTGNGRMLAVAMATAISTTLVLWLIYAFTPLL